jgi:hypothetical protein
MQINYSRLLMKKREVKNDEKHKLVEECITLIGDKYKELCYKHDGCRVIQAMIKYGNRPQREQIVKAIEEQYLHLMTQKYSHHLAAKAYQYTPTDEQKARFRSLVNS